ncbi:Retrovirus-related Pol polyprotein from transposon [Trichinella pseudospiralis]|uniref:Retrovirus-related Pol polyprotein from transposon n=1 Tax=Trichinella pseudospiralis TaxID=6337 RepID=A0A0V1JRK8_TRIPS|nr:Retrovirus-related Pol polyprotein from transposon [Trichinella pseudospiralis]
MVPFFVHIIPDKNIGTDAGKTKSAFDMLKTSLISSLILAYLDFEPMFIIDVDAIRDSLGAALSQNIDGSAQMVSYASRSLTKAEGGYCITRLWVTVNLGHTSVECIFS